MKGINAIKDIAPLLNLKEDLVNKAFEILVKAEEEGTIKGQKNEAKAATAIFIASKLMNQARDKRRILVASKITEKRFNRCFKLMVKASPHSNIMADAS